MKKCADKRWFAMALLAVALAVAATRGADSRRRRSAPASQRASSSRRFRRCRGSGLRTSPPQNGLPDNHVYAVLVDGDRIWAGTDNGLGLYENGKWKTYIDERWFGAPRRAFAGAGQAHRAMCGPAPWAG